MSRGRLNSRIYSSGTRQLGAIKLANAMGPGIVSMSFGGNEGSWTASVDAAFTAPNMSYLAATGDSGAAVSWPAVSPKVLAVGGTSLMYSGAGPRTEVAWSGTGGGSSAFTAAPNYQNSAVPGMWAVTGRTVADVAMNADPATGQYVAVMSPGSSTVNWISAGGTSLSTPQWAGLLAVANAQRALAAKPVLGAAHSLLYGTIAVASGTYASAFADITQGSHGSCVRCHAGVGYDQLTGLGTPNGAGLLSALTSAGGSVPPVVAPASMLGKVGTALSFTVAVTASNPVVFSLTGAPSGMTINSSGVVTWPSPVAGTYAVTVNAKDSKTGLSGQGLYTITIAAPKAPVVTSVTANATVGKAWSLTVAVTADNPVSYVLCGAPTGMSISSAGLLAWASPVAGSYKVTVTAKDSKSGLTGQGVVTLTVAAAPAPVVTAASVKGRVGVALSFPVVVTASNPVTYSLTGAPTGMSISSAGVLAWASPVAGSYKVTVTAKDSKTGLTGQAVLSVSIDAQGPVITAPAMSGQVGQMLTGSIVITDPGATSLSVSISGVPLGMYFVVSGTTLTAYWPQPVAGTYKLSIAVQDSNGLSAQATVPITVK